MTHTRYAGMSKRHRRRHAEISIEIVRAAARRREAMRKNDARREYEAARQVLDFVKLAQEETHLRAWIAHDTLRTYIVALDLHQRHLGYSASWRHKQAGKFYMLSDRFKTLGKAQDALRGAALALKR